MVSCMASDHALPSDAIALSVQAWRSIDSNRSAGSTASFRSPSMIAFMRSDGGFFLEIQVDVPTERVFDIELQRKLDMAVRDSLQIDPRARAARLVSALTQPRRVEVFSFAFIRNPAVIAEVLARAQGFCEACGAAAPFIRRSDGPLILKCTIRRGSQTVVKILCRTQLLCVQTATAANITADTTYRTLSPQVVSVRWPITGSPFQSLPIANRIATHVVTSRSDLYYSHWLCEHFSVGVWNLKCDRAHSYLSMLKAPPATGRKSHLSITFRPEACSTPCAYAPICALYSRANSSQ